MFALRSRGAPAIAAGMLSGLLLGSAAEAGQGAQGTKAKGPHAHAIAELRATRALLLKADHDYKGHRVKAIHDITKAIHALQPGVKHHPKQTAKSGQGRAKGQGNNEPQSVSDAHLRQAIRQLEAVQKHLGSGQVGHVGQAHADIGRAIHELRRALKVI